MEGLSILLYDRDADYIRNLARSLRKFIDPSIGIETYSDAERLRKTGIFPETKRKGDGKYSDLTGKRTEIDGCKENYLEKEQSIDVQEGQVIVPDSGRGKSSSSHIEQRFGDKFGFRVSQNGNKEFPSDNLELIYKYQPVTQIAQLLQQALPKIQQNVQEQHLRMKQRWYGIFSLDRQDAAMAFSCSMAGILGENRKVLLLVLTQFSGIGQLLSKEQGCDTEGFFLQLRRAQVDEFQQITMPEVLVFSDFELLKEPENPEVLCELEPEDLQKLIRYLDGSAYDAVVWIAGQALRGMRQLLERSSRVFVPETADAYSICRQQAMEHYCRKLPGNLWEEKVRSIFFPDCEKSECGEHLLWLWRQSTIGQKAEACIKESEADGC